MQPTLDATSRPLLTRSSERRVVLAATLGSFLTSLDASAVNAVLPLVREAFQCTIPTVQWVLLGEMLFVSGLLLVFGRCGDQLGHKRIYLAGFIVFLVGCSLCAAAPCIGALITFRILQGTGTAMILASSPALLVSHLPAERHGQALGLRASLIYLGLAAGPAVGGFLAGHFGWRAVFWLQLPVGLLGFMLARRFIRDGLQVKRPPRVHFLGAVTWTGGLATLLFALNLGNSWGWTYAGVLVLLLISSALLSLGGHPNPAIHGHLKTGQRSN